ncbi:hypothetical protein HMPREF9549_04473, partial [Escherichia coli MS 185-1]
MFCTDFPQIIQLTATLRATAFFRLQTVYFTGKVCRERTTMARLPQLAGNLWIVFPPTVTIAVLFALFQQGLSLFNFTTQFFRTGTEQHPAQFF